MADQAPEHAELRRRAFSRDGTEEDRRRLAEFEAAATPPERIPVEPPATPRDENVEDAAAETGTSAPAVRRPLLAGIGLGLLVGIGGAVTVDAALTERPVDDLPAAVPEPAPALDQRALESIVQVLGDDSLAVFDIPATDEDVPPSPAFEHLMDGASEVAVRRLGEWGDIEIFGGVGTRDGLRHVCLLTLGPSTGSGSCTTLDDFELGGIRHPDAGVIFRWGPTGPPYMLGSPSTLG